jgi:hypothetical protein
MHCTALEAEKLQERPQGHLSRLSAMSAENR